MHSVYLLSHRHGPPHSPLPVKAGAIRPDSDEGRYALRTIKDSPSAPPRGERYALKCIVKRPQYKASHSGGRNYNFWCLWNQQAIPYWSETIRNFVCPETIANEQISSFLKNLKNEQ